MNQAIIQDKNDSSKFLVAYENDNKRPCPFKANEKYWRVLNEKEIVLLENQGNKADLWENLRVRDGFDARHVHDCCFYGINYIGILQKGFLKNAHLQLPIGLYSSFFISCDIADNVAIHNVGYVSRTRVEAQCLLFDVDEISGTHSPRFGKESLLNDEDGETWLHIANENGGRKILPFNGMRCSDVWMWSKYRDDVKLMSCFTEMTGAEYSKYTDYSVIGSGTLIKSSRSIHNISTGTATRIDGANKINNIIINSSQQNPSYIGSGCELENGIIGYSCQVYNGVKALNFILHDHCMLNNGARFIHSVLGEHSSISCCEILNSLMFFAHTQHHNSSFLCASVIKGMSNMAAAATVGSNHNSRAADGEIVADRGFWPGLNVSLKHNSRFAAFTLIVTGSYSAELNISLPFSLVSNDEHKGELKLIPAYWFRYNMYALFRNSKKAAQKFHALYHSKHIECDWLAPDTVDQMLAARITLENWSRKLMGEMSLAKTDPHLLLDAKTLESTSRPTRILHAGLAWRDYGRMIRFYAVRILLTCKEYETLMRAKSDSSTIITDAWQNIGGQLMRTSSLERIKTEIRTGKIQSWESVHAAYDEVAKEYENEKKKHAKEVLAMVLDEKVTAKELIAEAQDTAQFIYDGIVASRRKDYENPFRNRVYDTEEERDAVVGRFEENEFLSLAMKDLQEFQDLVQRSNF